jgi:pimeloyl-ACP methyl ester carboxylesterase
MHIVKHQVGVREFLGVTALAGGLVLVVIGLIELLGSTDRGKRRWLLVLALPATYLLVQFLLLPLGFAFYVTNAPRSQLGPRTPLDVGVPYTDVQMTADGTTLVGWWVTSRNGAAVIVLHGSGSTRDDVLDHAALLAEHGYGILMYDARGHGESGGRIMELGWNTVRDVSVGIDYVLAQPDVTERVGILGLSMGGEVALAAAASDPRIAAVVSEGAGVPTFQDMRAVEPPFTSASGWVTYSVADFLSDTGPPIPLVEAVNTIAPRPVLLISGADAPERRANPVYAAGGVSTTLWELPDTAHTQALATHPHEYERRVTGFLATALLLVGPIRPRTFR